MSENKNVQYWREKLVDYTDMTPNEPRYNADGLLDDITYYPLGNRYPNKYTKSLSELPLCFAEQSTEEWFIGRLNEMRIELSIKYLQVKALKKYIIKNYKSILIPNPFNLLSYTEYPADKNKDAFNEIVKILINNYDNYIELICQIKGNNIVVNYLYEYLPIDKSNTCSLCLLTEPKNDLINCCLCKTHANCLVKLHSYKPLNKCTICNSDYKINEPVNRLNKLFFPFNDMYYEPSIFGSALTKYTGMYRLTMAIIYLQVERVEELLKEQEILDGLSTYYFGNEGYKQTPLIALSTGNLYSNEHITIGINRQRYFLIFKMLLDTNRIDIKAVDIFGKTAFDYIKELDDASRYLFNLSIKDSLINKLENIKKSFIYA